MRRWTPHAAAAAVLLAYAALKLYGYNYAVGDENIYFYMAERARHGVLPYRDFFFAHPPLHLLPAVIAFAATGGFTLAASKLLPAAAAALAGVFVYRLGRRVGAWEGVLACAFFLLSYDVLRASSHFTGTNFAVMWAAFGLERLAAGRDRQSAAAFACGAMTAVYAAPTGAAAALALLLADPRRAARFAAFGLGVFAAMNLLCAFAFGGAFLDQVYLYHLRKPEAEDAFGSAFAPIFFHNAWLLWGAVVGVAALALDLTEAPAAPQTRAERRRGEGPPGWWAALKRLPAERPALAAPALALAVNLLFLTLIARVFHFYFQMVFACAAPLCGYSLFSLARGTARAFRPPAGADPQRLLLKAAALLALLVVGEPVRGYAYSNLSWSKEEGDVSTYSFRPSGLHALDAVVRRLFWEDERVIGRRYWEWTYYLWHESRDFNAGAEKLAAEVRARTSEGDTIFGDSTTAPLLALLAGRRLSLDEADTNVMRFRSGMTPESSLLARLDEDESPPRLIVASPRRGIYTMQSFRAWADASYETAFTWRDPYQGTYLLLGRR